MAMLFVGSFVVGMLASVFLPVTPFVCVLVSAIVLSVLPILFGHVSFGPYVFAVASGVVLAQIGYVVGLVAQAFVVPAGRRSRLPASLRDLIIHRRGL